MTTSNRSFIKSNYFLFFHKFSAIKVVAIKLVPVESDLHEIIKEISIMQQCDSPYVVRYYGSYFKQCDLWVSINHMNMHTYRVIILTATTTNMLLSSLHF